MTPPDEEEVTYLLTFPDGTKVGTGQLGQWLQMVKDDPTTSGEEIELAEAIVRNIRATCN